MSTVSNVTVAKPKKAGAISIADYGTTLPTDATSALDAAFENTGYVSEDGVTNSNSPESDNIRAWGKDIVYVINSARDDVFKFTLIESLNGTVLKAVYGSDNVTVGDNAITVKANTDDLPEKSYVIDTILRDDTLKRIVIPRGKITEVGDIVYKDEELVGYEISVTCMPDDAGNTHYEYISTESSNKAKAETTEG